MSQQSEALALVSPEQLAEIARTAKALQAALLPGGPALPRPVREFGDAMTPDAALALVGRLSELESQLAELRADQMKQFEGGLSMKNFITEQGNELNKAKAALAAAEARATGLQTELAEQEVEKLRLVEEVEAMKLVDVAHRERNRRIIVAATAPPLTFDEAEKLAKAGWTPEKVEEINSAPTLVGDETPAPRLVSQKTIVSVLGPWSEIQPRTPTDSQLPFDPGFTPKCHGCGLDSHVQRCKTAGCPAKTAAAASLVAEKGPADV